MHSPSPDHRPNQVVSASRNPASVPSPTQATCPSGLTSTADATAAGLSLELAIKHANSLDPAKVRDALASLDVNTFYGRLKFDTQGQNTFHNVLVVQILNGQVQTVWPTELASATGTWPTPTFETRFGVAAAPPKAKLPGTGQPPAHR